MKRRHTSFDGNFGQPLDQVGVGVYAAWAPGKNMVPMVAILGAKHANLVVREGTY
ncbi:MAG: hypothetical protein IT427_16170 [Pirellulales bacterium]|nr:hypothetical protein [Pirellulales bacterium]